MLNSAHTSNISNGNITGEPCWICGDLGAGQIFTPAVSDGLQQQKRRYSSPDSRCCRSRAYCPQLSRSLWHSGRQHPCPIAQPSKPGNIKGDRGEVSRDLFHGLQELPQAKLGPCGYHRHSESFPFPQPTPEFDAHRTECDSVYGHGSESKSYPQ